MQGIHMPSINEKFKMYKNRKTGKYYLGTSEEYKKSKQLHYTIMG